MFDFKIHAKKVEMQKMGKNAKIRQIMNVQFQKSCRKRQKCIQFENSYKKMQKRVENIISKNMQKGRNAKL